MFRELAKLEEGSAPFQRQRDRIVERCLPLADHIARRFDGRGEPRDDLVQVARVGLVNAVIRFNVEAGSDFVSFAVPTIMGEVRRHFRDNSWSVKVPRRMKELHLQIGTASAEMSQRLGRAPTASELATELGSDRDEVLDGRLGTAGAEQPPQAVHLGGGPRAQALRDGGVFRVDGDDLAGDVLSVLGRQEQRDAGEVLGHTDAAEREAMMAELKAGLAEAEDIIAGQAAQVFQEIGQW